MECKTILISQFPLPYPKIGSWSTMYKNYLESNHQIDFLICEKPATTFNTIEYAFVKHDLITRIKAKVLKNNKIAYLKALDSIIKKDCNYIIQVVDNNGLILHLHNYLTDKGIRKNCYIQFFYHGFPPFIKDKNDTVFFKVIDEMVMLTIKSKATFLEYYTKISCKFSVLYNGIDTKKFTKIPISEKVKLKKHLGIQEEKVFLWCSQDRPKKGLHIVLEAWKQIVENYTNVRLLVVGTDKKEEIDGITYVGKVPNDELPQYYQISDVYLFPTLCQEGFGMSLAEALNCGCYCIASENGGVTEVLQNGKLGKLIRNPNSVSEWEIAIKNYLDKTEIPITLDKPIYTFEEWKINMNTIITNAKQFFNV